MNVLAELHTEPDLKLNLKFEIEVLCKTLNIDFNVCVLLIFFFKKIKLIECSVQCINFLTRFFSKAL